ncbi:acyl carrier protein [Spirillospora sp. CA-253888]
MLGADLDLEADLSIDSIKRTEIIGELAERVGATAAGGRLDESAVEQLARIKTIGGIVAWIGERAGTQPAGEPAGEEAAPDAPAAAPDPAVPEPEAPAPDAPAPDAPAPDAPADEPAVVAPLRQVVRVADLPALPAVELRPDAFAGRRFVIVDDGCGVALELADLLEQQGAQVRVPLEPDGPCDGLIHLAALRPGGGPVLPGAYAGVRDALAAGCAGCCSAPAPAARSASTTTAASATPRRARACAASPAPSPGSTPRRWCARWTWTSRTARAPSRCGCWPS